MARPRAVDLKNHVPVAARRALRRFVRVRLYPGYASLCALVLGQPTLLRALNRRYAGLSPERKHLLWRATAKVYGSARPPRHSRTWTVDVAGRPLVLPLLTDRMWLDWDHAVSVLGNDITVKAAYLDRIESRSVDYFLDIGANYGTHSLLFLVSGVPTLSFEPNPACQEVFEECCALNGVAPDLRLVALGESPGTGVLSFPERETWLGSLSGGPATGAGSRSHEVSIQTLDDFTDLVHGRVLVKVDVEGYEIRVLGGGSRFLAEHSPEVVFESNLGDPSRPELYDFLRDRSYEVGRLPRFDEPLTRAGFCESLDTNFLAAPQRRAAGAGHGRSSASS